MSVPTFMELDGLLPDHQTMLRRGDLLVHDPETMTDNTLFISHQWTSHAHADASGRQLKTLQTVFRRLLSGEIPQVEGDWRFQLGTKGNRVVTAKEWQERLPKSFLWIDFCCIPQMSIPLTEELLGFGLQNPRRATANCAATGVAGVKDEGKMEGVREEEEGGREERRRASLFLVANAVNQEMAAIKSSSSSRPGRRMLVGYRPSFVSSFRMVHKTSMNETAAEQKADLLGGGEGSGDHEDDDNKAVGGKDDCDVESVTGDDGSKGATTDHRHVTASTESWKKVNKIMLGKAVQSIPAYIERSSLIVVLVPPCKHVDRDDEICDQTSWRGRGWCRVEFLGATLVRSNVSVMIVQDAQSPPVFVLPADSLQMPPGHGTYT